MRIIDGDVSLEIFFDRSVVTYSFKDYKKIDANLELIYDLKAICGLDPGIEMANIVAYEMMAGDDEHEDYKLISRFVQLTFYPMCFIVRELIENK